MVMNMFILIIIIIIIIILVNCICSNKRLPSQAFLLHHQHCHTEKSWMYHHDNPNTTIIANLNRAQHIISQVRYKESIQKIYDILETR